MAWTKLILEGDSPTFAGIKGTSLVHTANNSLFMLGGGNATNAGANLSLYGGTNANAGRFRLRNGTTDTLVIEGSGNATFSGNVNVPEYIKHVGNTSNYLRFQSNQLDIANTTTKFVSSEILMSNDYAIKWNSANTRIYGHDGNNMLRFDVGGTSEVLKLTSTLATFGGNVGIGVSPSYTLDVSDDGTWASRITNSNSVEGKSALLVKTTSEHDGTMILGAYSGSSYKFKVQGDGKVGIGVTDPMDYLEINGSGGGIGGLTIANSTHNHSALSFARSGSATARIFTSEPGAVNTSAMHFQTGIASGPALVTAMTIDESQNVGIGTTAPNEGKLVVQDGTKAELVIKTSATATNTEAALMFKISTDTVDQRKKGGIIYKDVGDNGVGDMFFVLDSTTDNGSATVADNAVMVLKNNGNVGIGTSSPSGTDIDGTVLEIKDSTNNVGLNINATNTAKTAMIELHADRPSDGNLAGNIQFFNNGATQIAEIRATRGSTDLKGDLVLRTSDTNRLYIDEDGKVGIGTDSPSTLLHVAGDTANGAYLSYINNTGSQSEDNGLHIQIASSGSGAHGLKVQTGGSANAFIVSGDGQVGLGYSSGSMTQTLNVNGGAYISGQVTATGGAVSAPTYSFVGDTDTGISRPTTNAINLVTSGAERMRIDSSGNVGIGTTSPISPLTIDGADGVYVRHTSSPTIAFDDTNVGATSSPITYIAGDAGGLAFGRANRNATTGRRTASTVMQSFDTSGNATFAGHVSLADSKYLKLGAGADFIIYHDGATNYVQAAKQDSDIILRGNDGGTGVNALTLDMSAGGRAIFADDVRVATADNIKVNDRALNGIILSQKVDDVQTNKSVGSSNVMLNSFTNFVAPANGKVMYEIQVWVDGASSKLCKVGVASNSNASTVVVPARRIAYVDESDQVICNIKVMETGLTAGTTYSRWAFGITNSGTASQYKWGYGGTVSTDWPPLILTVMTAGI